MTEVKNSFKHGDFEKGTQVIIKSTESQFSALQYDFSVQGDKDANGVAGEQANLLQIDHNPGYFIPFGKLIELGGGLVAHPVALEPCEGDRPNRFKTIRGVCGHDAVPIEGDPEFKT